MVLWGRMMSCPPCFVSVEGHRCTFISTNTSLHSCTILENYSDNQYVYHSEKRHRDGRLFGPGKFTFLPPQCHDKRHLTATQGLEVVKQLLQQPEPHNFILGVRDIERTRAAYKDAGLDNSKHTLHLLQLDLSDLRSVQLFVQKALAQLGPNKLDLLFLNAGVLDDASGPGPHGSQWCQGYVVNHLGEQHFNFGSQNPTQDLI